MRAVYLLPFLFCVVRIFAQSKENERAAFGFFTGLETQSLGIENLNRRWPEGLIAGASRPSTGVSLGVFARKPIWPWMHFQSQFGLTYVQNEVVFKPDGNRPYRFLDLELPLHLVLSDPRYADAPLQACVLVGGNFAWNLANNSTDFLQVAPERLAVELGLGAKIKMKRWRIQPAFIYSHGLNDLHIVEDATYDQVVGRIVRDKLSLRVLVWRPKK